jgi:formylglycine-generating enzyme
MRIKTAVLLQCILFCTQSVSAVNIEMVTVGNPGNAPGHALYIGPAGFGAVNYVYQIGKYEVTAGQYAEFLNAVAKDDPNGLYNTVMGDISDTLLAQGCNIQRTGISPNFSYSVAADWANRPVNYVTFWDAARFANWLHNGQPTGPQGPGTTEDGAYHDVGNQNLFGRNVNAKFFIPTLDEWSKAAYHKNDGATGNYWNYAVGSNTVPLNTLPDPGKHANIYDRRLTHPYTIGSPYYRTEVGAFQNSPSPYGTFDQDGNVLEWIETKYSNSSTPDPSPYRLIAGGSYERGVESDLLGTPRLGGAGGSPGLVFQFMGFRIAAAAPVPEPTSLALFFIAAVMLGVSRFRTRRGKLL